MYEIIRTLILSKVEFINMEHVGVYFLRKCEIIERY